MSTKEPNFTHEKWMEIEEFPNYSVSDMGRVRNDHLGRLLTLTQTQDGIVKVGMSKDAKQHARSVALLVATYFIDRPPDMTVFDTPINLDGDRTNNRADNLMWRPRWFAIKFHKQFLDGARQGYKVPIQILSTGEIHKNSMEVAKRYGILAEDTVKAVINHTYVFPTFQKFKVVEERIDE